MSLSVGAAVPEYAHHKNAGYGEYGAGDEEQKSDSTAISPPEQVVSLHEEDQRDTSEAGETTRDIDRQCCNPETDSSV